MGLGAFILVALIALAIAIIMLWGAFSALYHVGRFLWHLMFTGKWRWDKP